MVFGQHFFSESLKSQGIKEVRVVWADGAWKIAEEKFYAEKIKVTGLHNSVRRKNIIPLNKFPFVIHVSSHSNKPEAISTSNSLRKNWYDAYTAPGSTNSSRKASCRARYSYSLSFYLASGGSELNRGG